MNQTIGTCSICGGAVEQCGAYYGVGPLPPARCRSCGATKKNPHGPVIPMERERIPEGPGDDLRWKTT